MIIHPEELSFRWIDRLADSGITTLGIHPRGGELSISTLTALLADAKTQIITYSRDALRSAF